jgi:hypothetical protein
MLFMSLLLQLFVDHVQENFQIGTLQFQGALGVATTDTSQAFPGVEGLMGLWFWPQTVQVPILNVLASTNALSENLIGIWLQKNNSPNVKAAAAGGEITFGGTNTQRYKGDIVYVNNLAGKVWTVGFQSSPSPFPPFPLFLYIY